MIFLGQTLGFKSSGAAPLGFALEKSLGSPLAQCLQARQSPLGDSFSTLPLRFSTVAFTMLSYKMGRHVQITEATKPFGSEMLTKQFCKRKSCEIMKAGREIL